MINEFEPYSLFNTSNINTFSFQSNDTIKMHAHHISATVTDAIKTQHGRVRVREASERGTCTTTTTPTYTYHIHAAAAAEAEADVTHDAEPSIERT